jgi:hypothetical protein
MGSGGDAGKGSGGACLPADSSGDDAINAAEEFPSIETPYGPAEQSLSNEALAARDSVKNGASLFKGGSIGHSLPPEESQFFSLEDPGSSGYGAKYGIPLANLPFDWVAEGQLRPGAPFITREAPGVDTNLGGGIEVVINPGDFMQEGGC